MPRPFEAASANLTLIDVQLASAYYPILVDLARHKHCLTYGELVALSSSSKDSVRKRPSAKH